MTGNEKEREEEKGVIQNMEITLSALDMEEIVKKHIQGLFKQQVSVKIISSTKEDTIVRVDVVVSNQTDHPMRIR